MTLYALDTNILVYAHNTEAKMHQKAKSFVERVMNERNADGELAVCLPSQVLVEFVSAITWQRIEKPLTLAQATDVIKDYLDSRIGILLPRETYLPNFIELMENTTSRKKIFDVALAATLKEHKISGIYTVNVNDFTSFGFLDVINPLEP